MHTLAWIIAVCLLGGAISLALAALLALNARTSWIPVLVSYAVGALLGAVFIEILPHAFELTKNTQATAATVMLGILFFFLLEKLVLWRHSHGEHELGAAHAHSHAHAHNHDHGRSGALIVVGDTVHNFVDGVLIAAAFMADFRLGIVTALAIIAHEIPQEVGDFLVLLNSGYKKSKALLVNVVSSLASVAGGIIGYFTLNSLQHWVPTLLSIAAASMIYVSVADLIPGLHKRVELRATFYQGVLIGLGILSILAAHLVLDH